MKVVAVRRLPKRGPKNGTRFWSLWKVNTTRPRKRVRNPDPILAPVFTQFSPLSSEFPLILKFATRRWKTSLGKFTTSCADFELAGASDQRAGNNKKQQQSRGIVRLCITPTSKQGLPALWRPFVRGNVFEHFSTPQNRPCIWVVVATLS